LRVIVAAILARSTQDDIVGGDDVAAPVCDAVDHGLERGILERLDLPTVVADEMVVMVATCVRRLEACNAVAEVHALDQAECVHPLERAIHARDSDPRALGACPLVQLVCGQAAVVLAEELDDGSPRTPAAAARLA
jgi:hypothetical protein